VNVREFGLAFPAGSVARQVALIPGKQLEFTVGSGAGILDFAITWNDQVPCLHLAPPMRVEKACDARTQPPNGDEGFTMMTTSHDRSTEPLVWIKEKGRIGSGEFGLVFPATHAHTGKRLAVKEFVRKEREIDCKMNEREINILTTLKHVSEIDQQSCMPSTDQPRLAKYHPVLPCSPSFPWTASTTHGSHGRKCS
jgi:hypothetical protein